MIDRSVMAAIRDRTKASSFDYYEEDEPLSVAQQYLKKLLKKQLCTKETSVESALDQGREFAPAVVFKPLAAEVQGLHSLEQYQLRREEHGHIDQLRELGLSSEEIELKLSCEVLGSPRKKRLRVEPAAQHERIQALEQKIRSREDSLKAPLKFKNAHQMSRHAMEVENSLFLHQGNPLTHLTVEDHHAIYPSRVIPDASSSHSDFRGRGSPSPAHSDSRGSPSPAHSDSRGSPSPAHSDSRGSPSPAHSDSRGSPSPAHSDSRASAGAAGDPIVPLPLQVIERHRLSEAEIRGIPRFKDYSAGEPSKVLFLKNLHHAVTEEDLMAVFGCLHVPPLVVRVMKGRMKGQAFAEFPSVTDAETGLNTVNGFLMRGKPVVMSYGRAHK